MCSKEVSELLQLHKSNFSRVSCTDFMPPGLCWPDSSLLGLIDLLTELRIMQGTRWHRWLRLYAISQMVVCFSPYEVTGFSQFI
jgi:hypothetical protein